jgi:hypothetical protein
MFALNIKRNSAIGKLICSDLKVLFWDEAAMAHVDIFDSVEKTLRELRKSDKPFGGVHVILGLDFRQTGPVIKNGSRAQQCNASIERSRHFCKFQKFQLLENIRVRNCEPTDPEHARRLDEWSKALLCIGDGQCLIPSEEYDDFTSSVPSLVTCKAIETLADVDEMIDRTFGELTALSHLEEDALSTHVAMHSAILCPLHVSVDYINARCLEKWNGDLKTKLSADAYSDNNDSLVVTLEQINARTPNGSPPHRLNLKKHMPLILLRNMSDGLMNGTRLILLEDRPNVLVCRVLNGSGSGRTVYLPRFVFTHEGPDQPLKWTRRQFPVKPCYAMTINKSQAQTLRAASVCLVQIADDGVGGIVVEAAEAFAHGQLYVGLSRCGDPDRMCVYETAERIASNTLWNVVYPEALGTSDPMTDLPEANRGSVMDPDDPRAHFDADEEFDDVPFHGYLFDETTYWDGMTNVQEAAVNRNVVNADEIIASMMNDDDRTYWDGRTTVQEAAVNQDVENADEFLASMISDEY